MEPGRLGETMSGAVGAAAADGDVAEFGGEAVLVGQSTGQLVEQGEIQVEGLAAVVTHRVLVVIPGHVVGHGPMGQVHVMNQALLLEVLEGPINGGQMDLGLVPTDPDGQLLGAQVLVAVADQSLEHGPPGGGDPLAPRAQEREHVLDVTAVGNGGHGRRLVAWVSRP